MKNFSTTAVLLFLVLLLSTNGPFRRCTKAITLRSTSTKKATPSRSGRIIPSISANSRKVKIGLLFRLFSYSALKEAVQAGASRHGTNVLFSNQLGHVWCFFHQSSGSSPPRRKIGRQASAIGFFRTSDGNLAIFWSGFPGLMVIVGVRRTSLRNLRSYSALIDELALLDEGLPNAGQMEGPPNAALVDGPPNAALVEGPPNAGLVEGPPNAEQQNNTRREEILVEMNAIENRIMAMDIVYVCLNKDIDALVEISDKRGGYGGFVKIRPANSFAKAYIAWRVQEGNFNSDLGN